MRSLTATTVTSTTVGRHPDIAVVAAAILTHIMVATITSQSPRPLPNAQQASTEPPERRRLSFETVDLSLHRRRQHWARSIPSKPAELVFQVLFGLRGDVPDLLLTLEIGDEVSGDSHIQTMKGMVGSTFMSALPGAPCPPCT